jgi:hypothetical protein
MATIESPKYIPIESLELASKLNLIGGGVLLLCAGWLLYKQNDDNWPIPSEWIILLIAGAIILALAGAVLRIFNGYFRYRLFKATIEHETLTLEQIEKLLEKLSQEEVLTILQTKKSLSQGNG